LDITTIPTVSNHRSNTLHLRICLGIVAALTAATSTALAVQQPTYLIDRPNFEAAQGQQPRDQRTIAHDPTWHHPAWAEFLAHERGIWRSIWDADTGVPLRIYGSGIAAPGAVKSAAHAERYARLYLQRHLALLAPGASADDFAQVSNRVDRGVRTVAFAQYHRGVPVLGGQVSFVFKQNRLVVIGSEALPHIDVHAAPRDAAPRAAVSDGEAERGALEWIRRDFGDDARVLAIEEPVVVPIVRAASAPDAGDASISYTTALVVVVETEARRGRWQVFVHATTGQPVARRQMLRFATAQVLYNTPQRWPGGPRLDYPALHSSITVNGGSQITGTEGHITWAGTDAASVTTTVTGPFVQIINAAGDLASASRTAFDGDALTWPDTGSEFTDAQITAFIHANIAKEYARSLDPDLAWLETPMQTTVNIDEVCNAYSDGDTINFFRQGSIQGFTCGNTAQLPDVVYHEFGHSLHGQSYIPGMGAFEYAFSEGLSDYYAATLTDDPAMGRGFLLTDDPLRHIDPPGREATWPDDVHQDPHVTGLIFAGAMWDLRKELIAVMGKQAGVAHADRLLYAAVQRAADIPSTYPAILAEDDDDGNLANGTPNQCLIDRAFSSHGLTGSAQGGGLMIELPRHNGWQISFRVLEPASAACAQPEITRAELTWELGTDPAVQGTVTMAASGDTYAARIPVQGENLVVRYRVTVELASGAVHRYPSNPADPMYEMFVGPVTEIYCTDFESDPFAQGWSTGAVSGVDDWQWGEPRGVYRDPLEAYSGTRVLGNNLSGPYSPDTGNYVDSPVIDVSGHDSVRLQYRRWLNVEDGYYDQATIRVNGAQLWQNASSDQGQSSDIHHTDMEWRFHDVDMTQAAQQGTVQVRFEIASDSGLELGGWTIDDFCIVAYQPSVCGDGVITGTEVCDDGAGNSDTTPDACRTSCQPAFCGDGVVDQGEQCDDGNAINGDGCDTSCAGEPGIEGEGAGGCCDAGAAPSSGAPLIWALALFAIAVILRRRRAR
jgi:uncharacterized protein (TIGR03382 family)